MTGMNNIAYEVVLVENLNIGMKRLIIEAQKVGTSSIASLWN